MRCQRCDLYVAPGSRHAKRLRYLLGVYQCIDEMACRRRQYMATQRARRRATVPLDSTKES